MQQLQIEDQNLLEQITLIFLDINEKIIESDEDIITELQEALKDSKEEDYNKVMAYLNQAYSNRSFLIKGNFLIQNEKGLEDEVFQQDYKLIYKDFITEKEYGKILQLIKNNKFCIENNIPKIIQQNIDILIKLGDSFKDFFEVYLFLQKEIAQEINLTQFQLLLKLIELIYHPQLTEDQICILEQILGSLLLNQIYEFQFFIDQLAEQSKENGSFEKFVQDLQQSKISDQPFVLLECSNDDYLFLAKLLTLDIRNSKNNLNLYFTDLFKLTNEQLKCQSIIEQLEKIITTSINIQQCYQMVVWHLWSQYSLFYKLSDELNKLIGNIKTLKEENRRLGVFQRFLKKQKQTGDEILTFFVHRSVCFSLQVDDFFLNKEQYEKYKQQKTLILMKQNQFKKYTLDEFLTINSTEFVNFCETIQQLEFKDLILHDKEEILQSFILFLWRMRFTESVFEKLKLIFWIDDPSLLSCASLIKLQFQYFSRGEVINLLTIASVFHKFDEDILNLFKKLYRHFGSFENGKFIIQFYEIIESQIKTSAQIHFVSQLEIQYWPKIAVAFDNSSLIKLANDLLSQYKQEKKFTRLVYHRIFNILFLFIDLNHSAQLSCFKILFENIEHKLLHLIIKLNCQEKIHFKIFNLTIYTLFALKFKLNADTLKFLFLNLKLLFNNQIYNFEFFHSLLVRNIEFKLIQLILKSHYHYVTQNFELLVSNCNSVFILNEELYLEWLKPLNYFNNFLITPLMLKRKSTSDQYPLDMNIKLEDFNISLAELTDIQQETIVCDWIDKMNDKEKFSKLIPLYFNIIKRGESADQLLSLIQSKKTKQISGFFNMKSLFQILYNNSNEELQVMLLKFRSKESPIPFLYQNPNIQSVKKKKDLFLFNQYIFYVFPNCYSIINLTLSKNITQIGKTSLINTVFYQMKRFEISDTCEINKSTLDIMFDNSFNGSRHFAVADAHGKIPKKILSKILVLFRLWIIQMNTEQELEENFTHLQNLQSRITESTSRVCFIVRNSSPSLILQYSKIIDQIKNSGVAIHFIQNLTLQGLDQQIQQNEVENASKFIYSQIQSNYLKEKFVSSSNFLSVLQNFNKKYRQISLKIEADGQIIKSLEDELNHLITKVDGFYCQEAFPMRCTVAKIKQMREELQKKRLETSEQNENVALLQLDIENLEKQTVGDSQTTILQLFCKIFENENYYVLYLWFVDRLRKFNEENTYQLQNENYELNADMSQKKIEKTAIKKNNEILKDKRLQEVNDKMNELKLKLDYNLRILSLRNIGIEIFWRELIQQTQLCKQFQYQINPAEVIFQMIKKGEPFEFLDGDQLKINSSFLQQLASKFELGGNEKILVLSVLGPQSSGKSTILNQIFGCHFWTSVGRCTKGIYLQLLKVHNKMQFDDMFDYILLLDTEGLQNPNQSDPEFDKKIALFVLAISDIILINVKGDINQQFRSLVEMCIYTLGQMKCDFSYVKQLSWCFNQNNDVNNFVPFLEQIQGIASSLNAEYINNNTQDDKLDYNEFLDIKKENIKILGFSSFEKSWKCNKNLGLFQEWRQQITNDTFSQEAYLYGIHIIKSFVQKFKQPQENQLMSNLNFFIQNIAGNWESISRLPDLLEFSELIQHQQNQFMKAQFEEIFENKKQQFSFVDDIRGDIQKSVSLCQKKTIMFFSQIQEKKEREISTQFEILRKQIEEDLSSLKQQHKISKKITQKYIRQLEHKINSQKSECKMWILEEIKNYERQNQENQGFAQIDTFVAELSSNNEKLKEYQDQPKLINDQFKKIWEQITAKLDEQQGKLFDEFQLNQYQSITQVFTQYILTSKHEQDYQLFFQGINKINPEKNQDEKENIFKKFQSELYDQQQFMILDRTQKNIRYMDIFYQPIQEKLKRASSEDLVNISQFYEYTGIWQVIEKSALTVYLTKGFYEDLIIQAQKCKKIKNFNQIYNFFLILEKFQISYDADLKKNLIDVIINPKFLTWKSAEEQIKIAFEKFIQKVNFDTKQEIFLEAPEFMMYFYQIYPNLQILSTQQQSFPTLDEVCKHRQFLLENQIVLKQIVEVKSRNNSNNKSFSEYIINPTGQAYSNQYLPQVVGTFHQIMLKNGGWQNLYSIIYDIIKNEMFNSKSLTEIGENQNDEDSFTFSNSLIKIIMTKIELQIVEFNKQFSNYGVILKDLGERCIYFYSLLIIWHFGCYKKWKMLENKWKLQKLYDTELEKFRAEVMQNKAEQSKLKAKTLVDDIFKGILDHFYAAKSSLAAAFIASKQISCIQIIKQLDEKHLEQSDKNLSTQQVDEVIKYIKDQRGFIEVFVNKHIVSLQTELSSYYEKILKDEIIQFFHQILQNVYTLKNSIIDSVKTKDYFSKGDQQIGFYESLLYQIVLGCIQGEQTQDLSILDEQYRDLFKNNYKKIQIQILTKIVNPSDQQIQQLKYFISEVSDQIELKINNIDQNVKFNLSLLNIKTKLDDQRLKMNGCQYSCPMCKRKCDQDNDGHNKHVCENGHWLRGMNGVLIGSRPSLFTCEEIDDEALITTQETNAVKTWKDIVKMYPEWQFRSRTEQDLQKHKTKMMKVWNEGVGQQLCVSLSKQLSKTVEFQKKQDIYYEPVHYILMLDDSGSMEGTKWQNVMNGAKQCMNDIGQNINAKVSVIIFNTTARVVIDCQKFNCGSQSQLITFQGGGTSFSKAFNCAYNQICKHQANQFSWINILFYTDGGDSYPCSEIEAFCNMQENVRKRITLIACTEESSAPVLSQIVEKVKPYFQRSELKNSIQASSIQQAWSEVVSQKYHKLRC